MGWLRINGAADQTVLALQDRVVTHNARISVSHENYVTWRLRIKQLRETDKACYMCQVCSQSMGKMDIFFGHVLRLNFFPISISTQINSSPMKKQIGCIDVQSEYSAFQFYFFSNQIKTNQTK